MILLEVVFMIQNRYLDQHEFALVPSHIAHYSRMHMRKWHIIIIIVTKKRKYYVVMSHNSASSPWLLHLSENFSLAQNLLIFLWEQRRPTCLCMKPTSWWTETGSSHAVFANGLCLYQLEWEMRRKRLTHHKTKSSFHLG